MTLCKFYQQGYCRNGSNCRFEHPNAAGNNRNQPSNRFGALGGSSGGSNGGEFESALSKYHITPDTIEKDLTIDAPQWILSAYAPGRNAPNQLFGGYPREQSFEELRLHYLTGKASGNEQQALNEAQQLYQNAKQQMESAARNVNEAARFIVEGANSHPNREDICNERTQGAPFGEFLVGKRPQPASNPFDGGAPASSAFGQPSALGQRPNPFGQPAQQPVFGQPSQPTSAFGQPSQTSSPFGQPPQGQPPQGQPPQGQPAFGQPSQPASAFGQPSALGAKPSPFGNPAFGQASQPNTTSNPFGQAQPQNAPANAFGQPGQLGQKPNPFASATGASASSFAAVNNNNNSNSNPPASNPFATASSGQANSAPNPFGTNNTNTNNTASPFGQPAQPPASNPFGQPSTSAANPFASTNQGPTPAASNPFAQQPQQSSFGSQANQQTGSSFGQTNGTPYGQPSSNANPFGQNQANGNSTQANPFAASQPQQQAPGGGGGGGGGGANSPYPPGSMKQHPPIGSYSSKDMTGRLSMFKGKPVTYKDGQPGIRTFDGTWSRIWFPDGPPGYNKDTQLPLGEYDDKSKTQWAQFGQTGTFADGLMPELPPLRECTQWDF